VAEVAAAVDTDLGAAVVDCDQSYHFGSVSCAILPPQSAADAASKLTYPCRLQTIERPDRATPRVVWPSAEVFALTPESPVCLSLVV